MLQNDEAFAFLPGFLVVIGIVTRFQEDGSRGREVAFSGRFAAFGSLSQRSRF